MRKVTLTISIALMAIAFVACKQSGPEAVVEKYYTHLQKGEFEEVKKIVLEEHHAIYNLMQQFAGEMSEEQKTKPVKVTDIKCETTDDVAICTCMLAEGDDAPEAKTLKLKKVDNAWFIDEGKETPAINDAEPTIQDEEIPENTENNEVVE